MLVNTFFKLNVFKNSFDIFSLTTRRLIFTNVKNCLNQKLDSIFEYSDDKQNKILNVLNQTSDTLVQLNVPPGQIKKLEVWKRRKGQFNSLHDLLELEGIDLKGLSLLCESIISEKPFEKTFRKSIPKGKQFLSPNITSEELKNVTSSIGINISSAGVSWVRILHENNRIDEWNFKTFSDLPEKINPIDSFKLAYRIVQNIPKADLYIFEATTGISILNKNHSSITASYMQQLELSSMMLTLLNTSSKHNVTLIENETPLDITNRVYFLKSKLPARLFQTLIGNEKVSTISGVTKLLDISQCSELPCLPVTCDTKIKEYFSYQSSIYKEIMGQSLMLIVTFINICIHQNPISLKAVNFYKKK